MDQMAAPQNIALDRRGTKRDIVVPGAAVEEDLLLLLRLLLRLLLLLLLWLRLLLLLSRVMPRRVLSGVLRRPRCHGVATVDDHGATTVSGRLNHVLRMLLSCMHLLRRWRRRCAGQRHLHIPANFGETAGEAEGRARCVALRIKRRARF